MRLRILFLDGLIALALAGQAFAGSAAPMPALRPGMFRIVETSATPDGGTRYVADASDGAKACSFEIVIGKAKTTASGFFGFAPAAIVRRPRADCATFLKALAPQLGLRGKLPAPRPADKLTASVAVLGVNQSRDSASPEGGFSSRPPGNWTVTKLFLAGGEGEVFLNLDAADHIGELSVKDEDYATIVMTELAKVLRSAR
jgi:hypothetical protein